MRANPRLTAVARSAAHRADMAVRERYAARGSPPPHTLDWDDYDALVEALASGLGGGPAMRRFTCEHPVDLQDPGAGVGKPYSVQLAYSDPGGGHRGAPRPPRAVSRTTSRTAPTIRATVAASRSACIGRQSTRRLSRSLTGRDPGPSP